MAPATLLSALERLHVSSCIRLPPEVLFSIFTHLDDVRDLYRSSLVDKTWRSVATDDRLWELHYWAFYRPIWGGDTKEELELQKYYDYRRKAGMRAWLKQTSSCPPSSALFEDHSQRVWQEIQRSSNSDDEDSQSLREVYNKLDDAAAAVPKPIVAPNELPMPQFLRKTDSSVKLPAFYCLFRSRLAADDKVLAKLHQHVALKRSVISDLFAIIAPDGAAARPLLTALVATQPITGDNVEKFLPSESVKADADAQDDAPWPNALSIHFAAARGATLPLYEHCLTLRLAALKALGYLDRGSAILSLQALQDQRRPFEDRIFKKGASAVARYQIRACSDAVERAVEEIALFRYAERNEIKQYLDLLSLFVWADLQAQERLAMADDDTKRPASPYPRGSTRHLLAHIVSSLRMLGFSVAWGATAHDTDNAFIHTALYCPVQRRTSELTLAIIVCAVAHRLGAAATISQVGAAATLSSPASPTLIVAVEDSSEPSEWSSQHGWSHFLVHADDPKQRFVREIEEFQSGATPEEEDATRIGQPLLPHTVLEQIARNIMLETSRGDLVNSVRYGKPQLYASEDEAIVKAASKHQIGRLRLFLEGRKAAPPSPLFTPTLALSFAELPPTTAHTSCTKPAHVAQDAEYCARWIDKTLNPEHLGGHESANEAVAQMITRVTSGVYNLDYEILVRLDLQHKSKTSKDGFLADLLASQEGEGPLLTPDYFRDFIHPLIVYDDQPALGLGCAGSNDTETHHRVVGEALPRRCLDPAYPANKMVQFGIGTVFQHRTLGVRAVIVGWDTECRACDCWKEANEVDDLPDGGRKQTFYQAIDEDMAEFYVAQCRVEPIQIPSGATREDAVQVLQSLVPLLNVRSFGKAFRTLRVVPWVAKAEAKGKGKLGETGSEEGAAEQSEEKEERRRMQPGQIYLAMNAWMEDAWPYE